MDPQLTVLLDGEEEIVVMAEEKGEEGLVKKGVALLSSKPMGNRIQIEDGEVIVRPSVVEIDCNAERWL